MSFLEGFESKEALLAYVEEKLVEKGGKFVFDEILDLKKESETRKTLLDKEIGLKKSAIKRAQDAETKSKELEEESEKHLSEIESLKSSGDHDEKMQAMAKDLAAAKSEARNKDTQITELQKKIDATKEPLEELDRLKAEARSTRIFDSVRKDAIEAKVPQEIYDSEEFRDHVLARFTIDENTDEVVTIGDIAMNGKQFVAAKQKQNSLWVHASQGAGAGPGKQRPSLDGRAERFKQAEAANDIRGMIENAPLVDIKSGD